MKVSPARSCDTASIRTRDVFTRNPTFCVPPAGAGIRTAWYAGSDSPAATASALTWSASVCSVARSRISMWPMTSGERINCRMASAAFVRCVVVAGEVLDVEAADGELVGGRHRHRHAGHVGADVAGGVSGSIL